jgi:hypothetical protein
MERTLEDVGAGVRFLKKHFERVVLIGNSGGASLMAFYQAQAERPFIHNTPAGDPISLTMEQCPPGDGIAILAGHPGRSHLMAHWIDPSVIEERDSLSAFPALNLFEPGRGVPFDAEFLEEYRSEQRARIERITAYAHRRLQYLRSLAEPIQDEALVVYRTYADPRFLDLTLDSNDRAIGGNRAGSDGSTKSTNNAVSTLARFSSLTGWLSQWSSESRADGPTNLAKTSVPVLQMEYTADASIFPSDVSRWSASCPGRETSVRVPRGTHYLKNQPELIELVASTVSDWANEIGPVQPHIASLEHS